MCQVIDVEDVSHEIKNEKAPVEAAPPVPTAQQFQDMMRAFLTSMQSPTPSTTRPAE